MQESNQGNNKPCNDPSIHFQVWYHANCDDGFGAAWAAYKFFEKEKKLHETVFIPVSYGKPHPPVHNKQVIYIVDFSYPRDILEKLRPQVHNLIILDHHKTAEAALKGFPNAIFDMDRSGAMITWNYFHPNVAPLLLRYVQANDLWKHSTMPECQALIRYIRTKKRTFADWDILNGLIETRFDMVIQQAKSVEAYFQTQMKYIAADFHFINFGGEVVPVVNSNYVFCSEVCNYLQETLRTAFAISWFSDCDNKVLVSLRSGDRAQGVYDVSALAKSYGGGGHQKAAGFAMPLNDWDKVIATPVHFKDPQEMEHFKQLEKAFKG